MAYYIQVVQITRESEALGCNIGAVEFFLTNDEPIFLEFNPMWGGNASKVGFGPKELRNYLDENRSTLEKKIPKVPWSSKKPLNLKPKITTFLFLCFGLSLFGIGEEPRVFT